MSLLSSQSSVFTRSKMNFILSLTVTVLLISLANGDSRNCPAKPNLQINLCLDRLKLNSKYRPIDGKLRNSCHNLGQSFKSYARFVPAHYDDCIWSFRRAVSGEELPPHEISSTMCYDPSIVHQCFEFPISSRRCLANS